jgi:Tfp pilus assembly protein PilN
LDEGFNMTAPNDLNFLPDDYVLARRRARANRLCGSLLAIVIVGIAGAFQYAERSLEALRAEHAQVSADFQREADRLQQLETLQKQQQILARRAGLAEALVERVPRVELLGELKELLPTNTSLMEVSMVSKVRPVIKTVEEQLAEKRASSDPKAKATPPEPKPKFYDVTLKIAGLAYTDVQVATLINRLTRSRYFDDVNLLVSREFSFDGQLVRRFEVEMRVRPEPLKTQGSDPVVSTEAMLRD